MLSSSVAFITLIFVVGFLLIWKFKSPLKKEAIYKIALKSDFNAENKADSIQLSALDENSGFMHASYGNQVKNTIEKFFKKSDEILVFELDLEALEKNGTILKPERNRPKGEIFPHFYGTQKISLKAIKNVIKLGN